MSGPPVAVAMERVLPSSRYRHPGDVIRLIAGSILLLVSLVASAAARRWLLGVDAPLGVAAALWHRRFRLLLGLAAGAAVAAGVTAGIVLLLGYRHPAALTDNLAHGSWLASAAFPGPALMAGAVAVIVAASPWLSRPWRRAAWL